MATLGQEVKEIIELYQRPPGPQTKKTAAGCQDRRGDRISAWWKGRLTANWRRDKGPLAVGGLCQAEPGVPDRRNPTQFTLDKEKKPWARN
jgi:hypothetical protein